MAAIDVACRADRDGWTCAVTIDDGRGRSRHTVTVSRDEQARLDPSAPSASDPSRLVRASFEFLLAREPKEAILGRFALPLIGRFFPEYEREIGGRIGPAGGPRP